MAGRLCSKCGADPSLGILEATAEAVVLRGGEVLAASGPQADRTGGARRNRGGKQHAHRQLMLKLVAGWTLLLVLIVGGLCWLWDEKEPARKSVAAAPKSATVSNENLVFLNNVVPKCVEILSGFLAAGTPESRNQFVLTPVLTSSRMARFYALNPLTHVDPQTLNLVASAVLNPSGGKAVETQWNCSDGRKIEAVFREENGDWRLDWDHYARYSDYPWALFLAGSGDPEGEFRLLVRERLADERKASETLSMVLYAPCFGQPGDVGFQSPEFLVARNGSDGKLLDAAFQLARSGGRVFGSTLANLNPEGMIRVRVKVRRLEVNLERKFEIVKVLACHWYALDEPGVEPFASVEEPPQAR